MTLCLRRFVSNRRGYFSSKIVARVADPIVSSACEVPRAT